jgi:hypothetical protein
MTLKRKEPTGSKFFLENKVIEQVNKFNLGGCYISYFVEEEEEEEEINHKM